MENPKYCMGYSQGGIVFWEWIFIYPYFRISRMIRKAKLGLRGRNSPVVGRWLGWIFFHYTLSMAVQFLSTSGFAQYGVLSSSSQQPKLFPNFIKTAFTYRLSTDEHLSPYENACSEKRSIQPNTRGQCNSKEKLRA